MSIIDKSTIVVDFDRTIFDSDRLYQDLYSLCEEEGISRNVLNPADALVPPDNLLFNFFLMIQCSQAITVDQATVAIKRMGSFVQNEGGCYVFADVIPFLRSVIDDGLQVIVLTYGDHQFQTAKFVGSKLSSFCNRFLVTSEAKWRRSEIFDSPSVFFLDDNPKNIDGVKEKFPQVSAVEVKREGTKYQSAHSLHADLVVHQLRWPFGLG